MQAEVRVARIVEAVGRYRSGRLSCLLVGCGVPTAPHGDNCVRYGGLTLQIPAQTHRHHFVKVRVRVHDYPDGRLAVFHGPRCLARYAPDGALLDTAETQQRAA